MSESEVLVRARGLWRAAYLAVLGLAGLYVSGRRLARLLLV